MAGRTAIRRLTDRSARRATAQKYADAITRKASSIQIMAEDQVASEQKVANLQAAVEGAKIVPDDGIPPTAPRNVVVTAHIHELIVSWTEPDAGEFVTGATIRAVPQGEPARLYQANTSSGVAFPLTSKPTTIEVQTKDAYGRVSAWSAAITETPLLTAAESIDIEQLKLADRISGQMPNVNLAPLASSEMFVEGVVDALSLAAGQNANMLDFGEAEFENYAVGAWPPPGVSSAATVNGTVSIVDVNGKKWGRCVTNASHVQGSPFAFFAAFDPRATVAGLGLTYIASVRVLNRSGAPKQVRILRQKASDAAGTGAAVDGGTLGFITVPANVETVVYTKFTSDVTKPFIRFLLYQDPSATIDYHNFQLESVPASKTQPSAYSMPAMSFGSMSGRLLAVMDAAVVAAVIGNAAIDTAQIGRLVADKIAAGTFTAGNFILSGLGKILAGGVELDSTGLTLGEATAREARTAEPRFKIQSTNDVGQLFFFKDTLYQGMSIRAHSGVVPGALWLGAYPTNQLGIEEGGVSSMEFYGRATGNGLAEINADLNVLGLFGFTTLQPHVISEIEIAPNGGIWSIPHNLGKSMGILEAQVLDGLNGWIPLPVIDGTVFVLENSANRIRVKNNRTTAQTCRVRGWRDKIE